MSDSEENHEQIYDYISLVSYKQNHSLGTIGGFVSAEFWGGEYDSID